MQPDEQEIRRLVTAVFRAWQQAKLDFLVLRNYEGLPSFTTNDIDVLVEPRHRCKAEQTLIEAARRSGFRLHNRAEFATLALFLSNPDSSAQAHFDLFTALKWRGFDFLDCRGFLQRKVQRDLFAIPHPADEAATNLLASMIFTGKVKEKYLPSIVAGFRDEAQAAKQLLAQTYGQAQARFIVEAGAAERLTEIEGRTGALRRTLILRQVTRHLWRTSKSLLTDAARLSRRIARPPGLTVVLCGADGCGKSTAAAALIESLNGTFSPAKGRHFHWKPPLFSQRRREDRVPTTSPHAQTARNPIASLVYFSFHWTEFFLGSLLRLRPITFRGGLILIDRFYYDFFVDQRRYRLRVPQWLVRLGYALMPKPDLVFLLDAPAEILQERKSEVPLDETRRQRAAYLELVRGLKNGCVIDATQPAAHVARDIVNRVLDFMAERASSRRRT
jgi:thymidylate kinase